MRRRSALALSSVMMVAILALTGCASTPTLDASLSKSMQESVRVAAAAAAEGDTSTALSTLDDLEKQLEAGTADGSVDSARATQITAAIEAVRSDLEKTGEPSPSPTASTPVVTSTPVAPADTTPTAPVAPGKDKGDKGNGKGNGKNKPGKP